MDLTLTEPAPAEPDAAAAEPDEPAPASLPALSGLVLLGAADAAACTDGTCG